jgi:hypothetical protein
MTIRDAFIASVMVTRCVRRTPISPFLQSPTSKPLEPGEGRAAGRIRRKFCHIVHSRLSSSIAEVNGVLQIQNLRLTCSKLGRMKREERRMFVRPDFGIPRLNRANFIRKLA